MNRHGEVMVWIHQTERRRDDAVTIGVGVVAHRDLKAIFETHQPRHRVGTRAIHPDLAVMIQSHEAKRRIDLVVDDREIEIVALGDSLPVGERRAAERIDADLYPRRANRFHVDHRGQIIDVGTEQVSFMRGWRLEAPRRRQFFSLRDCLRAADRWLVVGSNR